MGYRKGYYKKDGTYVQGHYVIKKNGKVNNFKKSNRLGCLSFFTFFSILVFCIACEDFDNNCEKKTCSDFKTQSEAQMYFDNNPDCYKSLDTDNDKIPCENSPN